ncbi:glycosyltransferase family 2 protein [Acidicapsa ligni]|uniref:glycosyltransferase family 2 protein n=1 Tax=Acidicapsa ligni TaxID=542300 RepID=UPI0021E02399|nr:glycosyltransferase family 2 protein [Acidicapsa ligni]
MQSTSSLPDEYQMTNLSIILVNWNCLAFTEQCIASICAVAPKVDYEVIVVDNASADAPCQSLVEKYPWVKLILSAKNIGFGQANNLGVRHSSGKVLFFLNPDTVVLEDALRRMLCELSAAPQAGAIGCRLLNPDRTLQTSSVQRFPTVFNQFLALSWLQRKWPNLPLWGKQALYYNGPRVIHEVDVVSGAAIMVRRNIFEEVGGFNPEYFMYAEEVELCYAIRRAGWKIMHSSDAKIIHFGGQSTKKRENGFVDIAMRQSVYRFLCRTRGNFYARIYRFFLLISAILRLILLACMSPFSIILNFPVDRETNAITLRKWLRIAEWSVGVGDGMHRLSIAKVGTSGPAD